VLLDDDLGWVVCDVRALAPNAAAVDALARLQLSARRLGLDVGLGNACDELLELIALVGLCDVLPVCAASRIESSGQTEEGEQSLGVEEEADPADPTG
jgi:hypothetical protein